MKFVFLFVVVLFCARAEAKVHCGDDHVVAKEGVEYALLGAWMPFADHKCFTGKRFKYFRPDLAEAEGEVTNWAAFTWFNKSRDKYKILGYAREGTKTKVNVRFTIKGKSFDTAYIYEPDPDYAKRVGICGYMTNPTHHIVRIDCAKPELVDAHIPADAR